MTGPNPAESYRRALAQLPIVTLIEILRGLGPYDRSVKPNELVGEIVEYHAQTRSVENLLANRVGRSGRLALGLLAVTETTEWSAAALSHALTALGESPAAALQELTAFGLLVPWREDPAIGPPALDTPRIALVAAPSALSAARTILPEGSPPPSIDQVRQKRETDGLEPILRLAALWQLVDEAPMRRTQQGTLYKRDRERIEDDPVLVGPIADSLEPLPDMASLWLALARGVGLLIDEPHSDRTVAAHAEYWSENAFHLAQMVAARWLGMRSWSEIGGEVEGEAARAVTSPITRPVALLWLATVPESEWVAIEDLAAHLDALVPGWAAPLLGQSAEDDPKLNRPRGKIEGDGGNPKRKNRGPDDVEPSPGVAALDAILLGPAYQFGMVVAAEENPSGRRVVQLSPLGRYALALGPPPPPKPTFEHFLFVQPNFEIIAYRQGLNAALIGQLSRFAKWTQAGAALEMKLTPESVYRGLEGGMTPEKILERLSKHSARPLPTGVADAVKSWSSRRDRITYYASATLIEFASPESLREALTLWPENSETPPVAITDRLLLVEDRDSIPFAKFRLAGSRDYRQPPEICVEGDPDGVTLSLDLSRSDLFIDTEINRLADELPGGERPDDGSAGRRRFRVTPGSLARAIAEGMTTTQLSRWFQQRTGVEIPPAIRLLLHAADHNPEMPRILRPVVLVLPTPDLLDGLMQHPSTRNYLGERLGPTSVAVPESFIAPLRKAMSEFGLNVSGD